MKNSLMIAIVLSAFPMASHADQICGKVTSLTSKTLVIHPTEDQMYTIGNPPSDTYKQVVEVVVAPSAGNTTATYQLIEGVQDRAIAMVTAALTSDVTACYDTVQYSMQLLRPSKK